MATLKEIAAAAAAAAAPKKKGLVVTSSPASGGNSSRQAPAPRLQPPPPPRMMAAEEVPEVLPWVPPNDRPSLQWYNAIHAQSTRLCVVLSQDRQHAWLALAPEIQGPSPLLLHRLPLLGTVADPTELSPCATSPGNDARPEPAPTSPRSAAERAGSDLADLCGPGPAFALEA